MTPAHRNRREAGLAIQGFAKLLSIELDKPKVVAGRIREHLEDLKAALVEIEEALKEYEEPR